MMSALGEASHVTRWRTLGVLTRGRTNRRCDESPILPLPAYSSSALDGQCRGIFQRLPPVGFPESWHSQMCSLDTIVGDSAKLGNSWRNFAPFHIAPAAGRILLATLTILPDRRHLSGRRGPINFCSGPIWPWVPPNNICIRYFPERCVRPRPPPPSRVMKSAGARFPGRSTKAGVKNADAIRGSGRIFGTSAGSLARAPFPLGSVSTPSTLPMRDIALRFVAELGGAHSSGARRHVIFLDQPRMRRTNPDKAGVVGPRRWNFSSVQRIRPRPVISQS